MNARKIWFALSLWLLLQSSWSDPATESLHAQTSQGSVGSRSLNASSTAKLPTLRYVQVSEASVYAGPSEDYYPTSILKHGDAVEVYDQTHDGWLAIRPPSGSFSWLPAAQGLLLPGGRVVEVTDKSAVSWIGTTLGSAKQYRWQVQLNRGEQLAVLGEQSMSDASSATKTLWYKITPPSGEYRWIPLKATSDQAPDAIERSTGQVMLASNEEPTDDQLVDDSIIESTESFDEQGEPRLDRRATSRAGRSPAGQPAVRNQGRPAAHPPAEDRWASWHAVEFKDGSFSFPGVARMLGITPAPTNRSASSYDPFDLTANARPRSASSSTAPNAALASSDASGAELAGNESTGTASQMAVRQSRGWRDPRELREARLQGGIRAGVEDNGDAIDALVDTNNMGDRDAYDQAVTNANYVSDEEIGSSVVAASAQGPNEAFRSRNGSSSSSMLASQGSTDEDSWYGIRQAPNSVPYKPMSLNNADLSEVQFQLSQMVTGPEYTWNLAPLADRTRTLIEHGVTAIERGEARLLMERIEQFAALAKRATELGMSAPAEPGPQLPLGTPSSLGANTGVAFNASPLSAAASRWVTPLGFNNVQDSGPTGPAAQFDATGWIVPVLGSSRDMPTHALTNDAGKIIVYLTPAAGVNLSRYSSQPIGVYGLRGYLPQLKTNHIQVQRVVRLQ